MLKKFAVRTGRYLLAASKRFARNQPMNQYETIAFSAIRACIIQFGRAVA